MDSSRLQVEASKLIKGLKGSAGSGESLSKMYPDIYSYLLDSVLNRLPADTRKPINDVSLWHHSKLTAAIAHCIMVDGGWRGSEPSDYRFGVLSGDGNKISQFILEATRLPDLNSRSSRVRDATAEAGAAVAKCLGPECVIFSGGGSLTQPSYP